MRNATISHVTGHAGVSVATVPRVRDATAPVAHDRVGIAAALRAMRGQVDGLLVMTPDLEATALLLGRADAERPPPGAARRELLPAQLVTRASTAAPPSGVSVRPGSSRSTRSQIPEIAP